MQNITPFLWFDHEAEEAAAFYTSLVQNSRITNVVRYGPGSPGPEGSVMTVAFELNGVEFTALNGGAQPGFNFTPAISFVINCETQAEVDKLWNGLSAGGRTDQCGWLTDKFGVTWQIVPVILPRLLADRNQERAQRVMRAMLQMTKLEIPKLEAAYRGE